MIFRTNSPYSHSPPEAKVGNWTLQGASCGSCTARHAKSVSYVGWWRIMTIYWWQRKRIKKAFCFLDVSGYFWIFLLYSADFCGTSAHNFSVTLLPSSSAAWIISSALRIRQTPDTRWPRSNPFSLVPTCQSRKVLSLNIFDDDHLKILLQRYLCRWHSNFHPANPQPELQVSVSHSTTTLFHWNILRRQDVTTWTIHLHRVPSFSQRLQGIHGEAQLAKDILELDRINRATLVLNATHAELCWHLSCAQVHSLPHLKSKQSRPCQRSWKHWPAHLL